MNILMRKNVVKDGFKDVLINLAMIMVMTTAFLMITVSVNAADSTTKPEKPKLKEVISTESGVAKVTWSKSKNATGYEIQYSKNKKWKNAKTVKIKKQSTTSKTLKKLWKTKDTYIRVRAYKKTGTKTVYSKWSSSARVIVWHSKWHLAKYSKIHTGTAVLYYVGAPTDDNLTVCINAGHGTVGGTSQMTLCHPDGTAKVTGGSTSSGAIYATSINGGTTLLNGTSESTATLKVAKATKNKLLKAGYNVLMIRQTEDVQLDNIARTVIANHYADCHISIHYDSTSSDKGAFAITVPNVTSYRNMEPVKSHWKEHNRLASKLVSGLNDKGVKIYSTGTMAIDLTQTSYSTIPSVDLEVGDRASSISAAQVKKIAKGIVKGVNKFF